MGSNPAAAPPPALSPLSDPRLPRPGGVLTRIYKGRLLEVTVLEDGFEYENRGLNSKRERS